MSGKASSTPGNRSINRAAVSLEYSIATIAAPLDLAEIIASIIASGATYEDGSLISGNLGTEFKIESINIVGYPAGTRVQDERTSGLVNSVQQGFSLTHNSLATIVESGESQYKKPVYDDFLITSLTDGDTGLQLDINLRQI